MSVRLLAKQSISASPTGRPANLDPGEFLKQLEALLRRAGIPSQRSALVPRCGPTTENDSLPLSTAQRIGRVVVFIEEHLDGPLSVERLAEVADLSRFHFSRMFTREVGQSPWSFVRDARIRRAKTLLENGASPAETALRAGFFDQAHLTNAMKRSEGTTPKKYQLEQLQDRTDLQD